jgi:hypothetical protein
LTTHEISIRITKAVITAGIIFIVLMSSSLLVSAASNKSNSAKNASLDIYSDRTCTNKISSISWGQLNVGESVNKTVYVKNTGTTTLTLSLVQADWYPESTINSTTCLWNRENTKLAPNQIVSAILILTATGNFNAPTNFSVDLNIVGKN